jgi:hypothetical protein
MILTKDFGMNISTEFIATIFFQFFQFTFLSVNVQRYGASKEFHPGVGIVFYMYFLFNQWISISSLAFKRYSKIMAFVNNMLLQNVRIKKTPKSTENDEDNESFCSCCDTTKTNEDLETLAKAKSDDELWGNLTSSRLDPSEPQNINSWLILRTKLLENDEIEADMNRALNMMNSTFIIVIAFMIGLFYILVFMKVEELEGVDQLNKSGNLTILSASFLFSILFPIIGVLNEAVNTEKIVSVLT